MLLLLDSVFGELSANCLTLQVGKLRLRQAVCDQVKSEFTKQIVNSSGKSHVLIPALTYDPLSLPPPTL